MANILLNKITSIAGREYISQSTGEFDSATQEVDASKSNAVKSVKNISWAVGSAGYIKLLWEGSGANTDTVFAILTGNGRWELGRNEFKPPATSNGIIKFTTVGFVATDTYTVVLSGNL
jgi:hypothetical protein